jgi:hypothetical protein
MELIKRVKAQGRRTDTAPGHEKLHQQPRHTTVPLMKHQKIQTTMMESEENKHHKKWLSEPT